MCEQLRTDAEIKANILSVYKDLGWSSSQAEGLDEADMTKEADTTKKAAASIPKGVNDIDSDDDKENGGKDKDDINAKAIDGGDDEDNNTLYPPKARKKGDKGSDEESLFSKDKDSNHDGHDSDSSNDESENKN